MTAPIDYIYENKLEVQPSFCGELNPHKRFGYRGELHISADTKPLLKHAIIVADDTSMQFFAAELANFDDFKTQFDTYKDFFTPETRITLFVSNLISDCVFQYEGITVYAFALDESSVWNELVSHAELDKRELKRMSPEDKINTLYDTIKDATLYAAKKTYEEACSLQMS